MAKSLVLFSLLFGFYAQAEDIALTIEEYDTTRNRASILVVDSSQVPLDTIIRVHSKTGTCEVHITEKVNDHLIGVTKGCEAGVIAPGMKLAYSTPNSWEQPSRQPSQEVTTSYDSPGTLREILDRTTLYVGHNFAGELEGNIYANGSQKNLDGDTAFTFGLKGRVYDFTDRLFAAVELGYETPRTLDRVTYSTAGTESKAGTMGHSPRLSLWNLAILGEAKLVDKINGFAGVNISIPTVSNSYLSARSDIGFQGGAHYQLFPHIALEGLIKITNINLKNDIGETTDVSLAGLELRGRYSF